jgi:Lon protease-like protein
MFGRRPSREARSLPLFPLHTVLFPGGLLPLKVFEQRYIAMTRTCVDRGEPFGVCLITKGDEVARSDASEPPQFAPIGTLARIVDWDMPEGVLHVRAEGGERFQVKSHAASADGLVVGNVVAIANEPSRPLPAAYEPLAKLLDVLAQRVGPSHFPATHAFDDASWVGYRLAELMPLPLTVKQTMLEVNDSEVRLAVLSKFLQQHGLL